MKVAIIVEAAGSTHALAMTAFVGALAEGLQQAGAEVRVIGLASSSDLWVPEALGSVTAVAPWLEPPRSQVRDVAEAWRTEVFDELYCGKTRHRCAGLDWYRELLLDRAIAQFMGGEHGVVLVYPRVYRMLNPAARIAARRGHNLVAFSTEALSDAMIDPAARDDYVGCVAGFCDGVWAVSRYLAGYWRDRGLAPERVFESLPPVRRSFFGRDLPAHQSKSAVYIGNLTHSDIDTLIDVAGLVRQEAPEFTVAVYGDASPSRFEELRAIIDDRGLSESIGLHPAVSPARVPEVLACASVLLLPRSSGEFSRAGFPNKLGEYLASGRPVVVTAVGDIPQYLVDGESAFLVPPDDTRAFADAVTRALSDSDRAAVVGGNGRALAEQLFRADVVGARALDFLESLEQTRSVLSGGESSFALRRLSGARRALAPDARRIVVRVLRRLHLKPPAPESETAA